MPILSLLFSYQGKMITVFVLPKITVTVKDGGSNWGFDRKLFLFYLLAAFARRSPIDPRGLGLIKQFERVTFLTQAQSFKGCSANN